MGARVTGSKIVGVINVTPDSFFRGSRVYTIEEARDSAQQMIASGVDVLELGGESTQPGSTAVSEDEELARVMPALLAIKEITDMPVSLDTRKSGVAKEAISAGVQIINDISALQNDPGMALLIAQHGIMVVLMHMQGSPQTMQDSPHYEDAPKEVAVFLQARATYAVNKGILPENIVLDPGIGFGKRFSDNVQILRSLSGLKDLGFSLMVGLSRKKFIGHLLREGEDVLSVHERLAGTLGGVAWCVMQGVDYIRVHDVRETNHLMRVLRELMDVE